MKNVLITGGSRGIGASIARCFARENFYVFINYRNDLSGARQTADEVVREGGQCDIVQFDVSDPLDVARGIEALKISRLDVLINNAGISIDNLIFEFTEDQIERVLDTNFFGACLVFDQCQDLLRAADGTVISMGSIAGARGRVGQAAYAVSKAMIIEWTERMAALEKEYGLRFYCISPGPVLTELVRSTPWAKDPKARERIPMNRFIEPHEIGEVVLSFVQNGVLLENGSNVFYDGGFLQTVKG